MIVLYSGVLMRKGYERFLEFDTLKDFNRYSKKWVGQDFKDLIDSKDSLDYKVFRINHRLRFTRVKIQVEHT